jgi:hypothetical protein
MFIAAIDSAWCSSTTLRPFSSHRVNAARERHADLLGRAPFESTMPYGAITENKVECFWDANRASHDDAGTRFREIEHPAACAGAKPEMGDASALEHPSPPLPASIRGCHGDHGMVTKLL